MKSKSTGVVVSTLLAIIGIAGLMVAFVANASAYGTFADARTEAGRSLHVAGDLVKESLVHDMRNGQVRFKMKDASGESQLVVLKGQAPANLGEATKVVAIGTMSDGAFQAKKLLVKCPSKYEGEKGAGS